MTGPEHYREAERLLAPRGRHDSLADPSARVARAQVHATLAVAAAIGGEHPPIIPGVPG